MYLARTLLQVVLMYFGVGDCITTREGSCLDMSSAENTSDVYDLSATSARTCHYWCTQKTRKPCAFWSFSRNKCNISSTPLVLSFNQSDCVYYNRLQELGVFAFWPLSNHSRGKNYGVGGSAFDAVKFGSVDYESDAAYMDGSTPGNQGFNISKVSSLNVAEFTFSVWIKHTNDKMILFEALNAAETSYHYTRFWVYNIATKLSLTAEYETTSIRTESVTGVLQPNTWQFVGCYANASNRELFKDGRILTGADLSFDGRTEAGNGPPKLGERLYLGTTKIGRSHAYQFTGRMKCAMFSDKILTETEIQEVMGYCH